MNNALDPVCCWNFDLFFSLTFITKAFRNAKPDMRLAKVKDHTSLEYINMQKCDDILGITGSF